MEQYTIDNDAAIHFLQENRAQKEHICISNADKWIACFDKNNLIGVIGINYGKNSDRIKAFYVVSNYRKCGVGNGLLTYAMRQVHARKVTAYATEASVLLFKSHGFREISINKNGIYFLEVCR